MADDHSGKFQNKIDGISLTKIAIQTKLSGGIVTNDLEMRATVKLVLLWCFCNRGHRLVGSEIVLK